MIVFQNKGLIDLETIRTFGVSIKEGDNPIGFFGTGLKYALAILLRRGQSIVLYRGLESYKFGTCLKSIRGEQVEIVTMNDQSLGFTLRLGTNWVLWHAYRELHSNTRDEGGVVFKAHRYKPSEGVTSFVVVGPEFEEVYESRSTIILEGEPDIEHADMDIHYRSSEYLYYRGIRIWKLASMSRYTYNLKGSLKLTEDRTIAEWPMTRIKIARSIARYLPVELLQKLITVRDTFEYSLDYEFCDRDSPRLVEAISNALADKQIDDSDINRDTLIFYTKYGHVPLELTPIELNEIQELQLKRAVRVSNQMGFEVQPYSIIVTNKLKRGTLGLAKNKTIYISLRCFELGTKFLTQTVIEEFVHLDTGFVDESRNLQNYLFEKLTSYAETYIIKEPI